MYVVYGMLFNAGLNTEFIGSTNTINICLILSTIYFFIPVSGCVGRTPVHCFPRRPIILLRRPVQLWRGHDEVLF